jgi:hypothetical protein
MTLLSLAVHALYGLPGMILGLSIPRLYTSFMATKIDLKISDAAIKPTIAKNMI